MQQKFEGWVSEEEYDRWTAETEAHDRMITEQMARQIEARRRLKAMETIKQYTAFFAHWLLVIALAMGTGWFIWQFIMAVPRFIEAWR